MSYLRSIHLQKDKSIFKVSELPADEFAASLGLPGTPKIKFLSKEKAKEKKNASRVAAALQAEISKERGIPAADEEDSEESEEESSEAEGDDEPVDADEDISPSAELKQEQKVRPLQRIHSPQYLCLFACSPTASARSTTACSNVKIKISCPSITTSSLIILWMRLLGMAVMTTSSLSSGRIMISQEMMGSLHPATCRSVN